MYHAIHAFGIAELLKIGEVANVDDGHYWNLIDNTYVDDVSASPWCRLSSNIFRSTKQCWPTDHQFTTMLTTFQSPTLPL